MKTKYIALCGLFAALAAVCSWITIPLGFTPVPVNLATLAVFLAGGLLGKKYGPLSLLIYVLVGAVGAPVFAGFQGGAGVLAGPTGGYIIGYIAAAFIIGLIIEKNSRWYISAVGMVCGLAACYLLGTAWFMFSTGTGLAPSLMMCVVPFLPGDGLKIAATTFLVTRLRRFI